VAEPFIERRTTPFDDSGRATPTLILARFPAFWPVPLRPPGESNTLEDSINLPLNAASGWFLTDYRRDLSNLMSDLAARVAGLTPAQRKLLEQRLKKQSAAPPGAEPIAIIGMACRFAGAPDLEAYWGLIHEGRSGVTEVPADRWDADAFYDPSGETAGKMSVRWAAFIEGPDQFDPQFFGITPREAVRMDPQQRILLEVAWQAMENAGRPAEELAGTKTGVFVGIGGTDYSKVGVPYDDYYEQIDAHLGTGNALSIAANRLSYVFDFHGPSAAVDTACSSSSLAIHFAVESLRRGESDTALAGGVNMILTPETTIAFSKARMLSPEGVCRPFDSRANGYVRGEGCGLVLLKRLADAERDGDNILAVIRATSVNQDGRTSGISAPNSQSQVECIRAAQKQAGFTPDDIDYIEAHGTGTPLGDPIEMIALAQIFKVDGNGVARPESSKGVASVAETSTPFAEPQGVPPCYVSSVKANVGHMETVSGVAGLIKVVLMMQHDEINPQTHFETLNPHIKLEGTRLVIPTEHLAWPRSKGRRVAGISSFGFGGTNTHLIVESANPKSEIRNPQLPDRPVHLVKLAAKNEPALKQQAAQLADYLDSHAEDSLADICWSANTGWADFNQRAAVVAKDSEELKNRLQALAGEVGAASRAAPESESPLRLGGPTAGVKQGVARSIGRPGVAFLFTGQGAQYVGMGRGLYETQPVFRRAMDSCDAILRECWGGESLLSILYPNAQANGSAGRPHPGPLPRLEDSPEGEGAKAGAKVHQTQYTQPALFSIEYALAELWASWGVLPDIVLGHSVGEYAAAVVAGVMSLEDGLRLIAERARLMQSVKRPGKMAVVFATREQVAQAIEAVGGEVVIAVINGPENIVISGAADAVEAVSAKLVGDGVQVKPLNVSHAFHSPLMDEMLDEFEAFAAKIEYEKPHVPLTANLTGQLMKAPTAHYWRDHLRNTVQFAAGMARIAESRPAIIIEMGPTASLLGMGRRCEPELTAAWLPSLREGQDDWQVIAGSLSEYYVRGGRVDWRGWDQPWQRKRVLLPNYPFQKSRHWFTLDPALRRLGSGGPSFAVGTTGDLKQTHPLLGPSLSTVWANKLFESRLSAQSPAYLVDHQVQGSAVTPAAAYIEQGLAAADQVFGPGNHGLANITIQQAMFLPEGVRRRVEVSIAPESGGEATFETYSRPEDSGAAAAWTMHARGSVVHESSAAEVGGVEYIDLVAARSRAVTILSRSEFYDVMAERGLAYGPAFQVLSDLHRGVKDAIAEVELPEAVRRDAAAYQLHPALGDALLQVVAGAVPLEEDGSFSPFTYMPVGIRNVRVRRRIEDYGQPLHVYAVRTSGESTPSPERVEANIYLVDGNGSVLVEFEGAQVQRLGRNGGADSGVDTSRWLYQIAWQQEPLRIAAGKDAGGKPWLIFADAGGVGWGLADRIAAAGGSCILVEHSQSFEPIAGAPENGHPARHIRYRIDPLDEAHYTRLINATLIAGKRGCAGIVHLWSLDIGKEPSPSPLLQGRGSALGCAGVLQLVRALSRSNLQGQPPLWLVTAGAQPIVADARGELSPVAIEQSPMIGFGRVASLELPDFRPRLLDLDAAEVAKNASDSAKVLLQELNATAHEGEVAYRNGKRFVARLERSPGLAVEAETNKSASLAIPKGAFQLRITQAGSLDALKFAAVEREKPAPGQVEIEVHATGLNFSDVLKALGLYPGIKDAIVPLGIETSGVVTAIGEGVTRFEVGDAVCGVAPYAFASHTRTADYALVPKPQSLSHEEACTIPITFLTAYYGIVRLAQMQPGERLLIHAGAGGVGLAAIQIAQNLGIEIFATAGSDTKRHFLRSLGVKHVYSSRSTAFAEEILADTNREGVDVVLNSLPGEAITKSLSILRAYGRFLEIGKTDIYQNRMIGLLPFQDNLSYFAIDLDRMLRQRPDYIRELFAEVMRFFEAGKYRPLEFTQFEAKSTVDAFRYMSQRKNIGKVVVSIQSQESRVDGQEPEQLADSATQVRGDGTYLITGGTGALGLQVADWLAEQGAGVIALMSRRAPSAEVEKAIEAIREKGSKVIVVRGDVADAASLENALTHLLADGPPLRGVLHAAGALADGILTEMTLEQLDRAVAPKVQGAWNLHDATRNAPLDFFVLFSSVASILGSPGQANYAAGNSYLDALAHARRSQGLTAIAINWGPWAGSGMATAAGRETNVKSKGMGLIEPEIGLELLGRLMKSDAAQVAVMDAAWSDMLRMLGSRRPALLDTIAEEVKDSGGETSTGRVDHAFRQQLLDADDATRKALVQEYIRQELARIIGVDPSGLETDQPLSTFGLDSLLALELKNNLEGRLDFTLPMAKLMEGPSIASLAEVTAQLVAGSAQAGGPANAGAQAAAEEWSPLLALQSNGARPPLFLLPALGGDVRCYAELCQQLGEEQPVYAFRPRGVDQDLPPHLTIDEMIRDYAAAVRDLQPAGPYFIAGWSAGGIFAFALAEAFERAGEEIALIAIFDAPLPAVFESVTVDDDAKFLCELVSFASRFSGIDLKIDHEQLSKLPAEEQFGFALAEARKSGIVPAETPEEFIRRLVRAGEANVRVLQGYTPNALARPVRMFVPTDKSALEGLTGGAVADDDDRGWSSRVGQAVELQEVPGDHFTMMLGEGAAIIAGQLSKDLAAGAAAKDREPQSAAR
jgi:acyl transferase domain-containing protein/thioesterase domain-containing protein/acyl carrier protein